MTSKGTPQRHVRVSDDLWRAAMDKAGRDGTRLSDLIRGWLTEYVNDGTQGEK